VDIFIIATDVQGVALNYGKKDQKFLDQSLLNRLSDT